MSREKYTGIYGSWYAMKQRCGNPKNKQYKDYGGRGITFKEEWNKFEVFKREMEEGYKKGLTLDRLDNSKGYFPENCRWATKQEQAENKRCNIVINGEKLVDIAKRMNINYGTLRSRFYRGMTYNEITKKGLYRPAKICQKSL